MKNLLIYPATIFALILLKAPMEEQDFLYLKS